MILWRWISRSLGCTIIDVDYGYPCIHLVYTNPTLTTWFGFVWEWNSQSGVCESGVFWVLHQSSHLSHNRDAPKQCGGFDECEQLECSGLHHSSLWSILSRRVLGPVLGIFCVLVHLHHRKHIKKLFLIIIDCVDENKGRNAPTKFYLSINSSCH